MYGKITNKYAENHPHVEISEVAIRLELTLAGLLRYRQQKLHQIKHTRLLSFT